MSAPLMLLASPDDYLLELERTDAERGWTEAHPGGELVSFSPAPLPDALLRELATPSLFVPSRLLVVRDGSPWVGAKGDGPKLAKALATVPLGDTALLVTAVTSAEPKGPLVEVFASRGEVRFLALPPAPKPWEEARFSLPQRRVLEAVVRRVAPALLADREVMDALLEAYGFRPRELAAAAERLALSGNLSAAAVRDQAGVAEGSVKDLEEALIKRDRAAAAGLLARLAAGGLLRDWRGEAINPERFGPMLGGTLGRLLRQALAMRGHALRVDLAAALDPGRCADSFWYQRRFKDKLFPRLAQDAESASGSPLAGATAWQMQRTFRVAAAYSDNELLRALGQLAATGAERARSGEAIAVLTTILLELLTPAAGAAKPASQRPSRRAR